MKKGDAINEASSFSSQIRSYLFMDGIILISPAGILKLLPAFP